MDINRILDKYFHSDQNFARIEMFDSQSIYAVYDKIIRELNKFADIELSILQGFGYCFYELLDNALIHSEKDCGVVVFRFDPSQEILKIVVADDGIGIHKSLKKNKKYRNLDEVESLKICIQDGVSDGHGMGFGLYSTSRLIGIGGLMLSIHSGVNEMYMNDVGNVAVSPCEEWQGALIYLELHTNKEIDANKVVDYRTDCISEYNDQFIDDTLDKLW